MIKVDYNSLVTPVKHLLVEHLSNIKEKNQNLQLMLTKEWPDTTKNYSIMSYMDKLFTWLVLNIYYRSKILMQ